MARRNPLLFTAEEYQFLHKVFLLESSKAKHFVSIKKKDGICLNPDEIQFVKQKFESWKEGHENDLLWMQ
jgi:hypothetical protein